MEIQSIASGSSGNAYRVSDGHTQLLLDAGISFVKLREALHYRIHDLAACLISHAHGDHTKAAAGLMRAGISVYASAGTIDACGFSGHNVVPVKAMHQFTVGTFSVLPFDVVHDTPEPLGYLLLSGITGEQLVYFTDTEYVKYRFKGLTHILGECNYSRADLDAAMASGKTDPKLATRVIRSHMSLERFLDFLRAADLHDVQQIYLLHLSTSNSDAERFKQQVQSVAGCEVYIA